MNIRKLLSITLLFLTFGLSASKINCDEIKSFGDFEKLFKNDVCYDHDGRIYIKDFSNLSKKEINKFWDSLDDWDTGLDRTDFFECVNTIFCYKQSDEFLGGKLTFNDKAYITKDGRFIGAMVYDISVMEKNTEDELIEGCSCPCCWDGVLYIQDKNNNITIMAKFVESFEFTQDGKFVVIIFKNGLKITFDLDAKKEVVSLRDYSKKNGFFDEIDAAIKNNFVY